MTTEILTYKIPAYLLGYLINGVTDNLTAEEIELADNFVQNEKIQTISPESEQYFSKSNDVGGLACDVIDCECLVEVTITNNFSHLIYITMATLSQITAKKLAHVLSEANRFGIDTNLIELDTAENMLKVIYHRAINYAAGKYIEFTQTSVSPKIWTGTHREKEIKITDSGIVIAGDFCNDISEIQRKFC